MVELRPRDPKDIYQRALGAPVPRPIAMDAAFPPRPGKAVRAVFPNAGVAAAYKRRMRSLIEEMARSYLWWMRAAYRANEPAVSIAMDATPAKELQRELDRLGIKWKTQFDEAAPELARYFARRMSRRSDAALKLILKRAGISVEFKMTAPMRDILEATIEENISLIRSIPAQFHTQVQGSVMRSVQTGRDLGTLTRELMRHHGVSARRAAIIAKDQNSKATSAMQRARQTDLGIEEGVWLHSHGGKVPRPTHVANHGKRFSIKEGWFDPDPKVRRRIWPGELIECKCVWKPVIPGLS